jgi:hypothetical protein
MENTNPELYITSFYFLGKEYWKGDSYDGWIDIDDKKKYSSSILSLQQDGLWMANLDPNVQGGWGGSGFVEACLYMVFPGAAAGGGDQSCNYCDSMTTAIFTPTPTPIPTDTPDPSWTATPIPPTVTPKDTKPPADTKVPTDTPDPSWTDTPIPPTATPKDTKPPADTKTPTPTAADTATPTNTPTVTRTPTNTNTNTPTPTKKVIS